MEQKKLEFLTKASIVYMQFGFKSVTMDEMARQLVMSKKTIYTFVRDKADLINQCLELNQEMEKCDITEIAEKHKNAIDELLAIGELVSTRLRSIHPSIFFDLMKYYPAVIQKFKQHKDTFVKQCVIENLEKGIKQGLYRDNLDSEIIAKMYLSFIDVLFQGDTFPTSEYTFTQVYSEYFRYHIRGIASDNGLKHLQKVLTNNNFNI
jgi:AcrR family transcriptional regulator